MAAGFYTLRGGAVFLPNQKIEGNFYQMGQRDRTSYRKGKDWMYLDGTHAWEGSLCRGKKRYSIEHFLPWAMKSKSSDECGLFLCVLLDHAKCFIRQTLLILVSFLLDRKTKTSKQTWFRGGKDLPDWPFQVTAYYWEKSGQELK